MTGFIRKAVDKFTATDIDDETVVMSLDTGDFFSLTGTARAIWKAIDGSQDRAALIADLAARYGCSDDELAGDVDAFLAQLSQAELIVGD